MELQDWVNKFETQNINELARFEMGLELMLENPYFMELHGTEFSLIKQGCKQVLAEKIQRENTRSYVIEHIIRESKKHGGWCPIDGRFCQEPGGCEACAVANPVDTDDTLTPEQLAHIWEVNNDL